MKKKHVIQIAEPPNKSGVFGLYEPFFMGEHAAPEELNQALRKQSRVYKDATDMQVYEGIMRNELESVRVYQGAAAWNTITRKLLDETFAAMLVDGAPVANDQKVKYLSVGTNYADPNENHVGLQREIIRKTPLTKARDGKFAKLFLFLDVDEGNGVLTQIAAGTNTVTTITLSDASGFNIGDALRVSTSPQQSFSSVVSITGNEIGLDPLEPLSSLPVVGQNVLLCIGEAGSYGNQGALAALGTGDLFSRTNLRFPKTNASALFIKTTIFGEPG